MHTVEAFLAVADVTGDNIWRERAGRIVCHVLEWAEENHWRIPEHFDENWNPLYTYNSEKKDDPFKPYGATPGHGIEKEAGIDGGIDHDHAVYPAEGVFLEG